MIPKVYYRFFFFFCCKHIFLLKCKEFKIVMNSSVIKLNKKFTLLAKHYEKCYFNHHFKVKLELDQI